MILIIQSVVPRQRLTHESENSFTFSQESK
jgi:hypothetical protein